MTVFESINNKNIDELAEWIDKYGVQDFSPWNMWFERNYCDKCVAEIIEKECAGCHRSMEYCWCELNDGKCKFFQDMNEVPWGKQLVKMWLESEE